MSTVPLLQWIRLKYPTVLALTGGFLALTMILFATQTKAANGINRQINYQAKLLTSAGVAVTDGNYSIKFSLYAASSGGTPVWTATGTVSSPLAATVTVTNGLFTILLGDTSANQNALDGVDWNSDTLYLGVTVGSDSEMTPRKRLAAVPQAFNAERLQGMYASGTASGGQTLFTVNQTENNAATGTRTALLVRSRGTSNANDLLIRGLDDTGSQVLSINRQGSVTSTGVAAFTGSGTSTLSGSLSVAGNVSSTRVIVDSALSVSGTVSINGRFNTDLLSFTDATYSFGSLTNRWLNGIFVNVSSTNATSTFLYAQNATIPTLTTTNLNASGLTWTNATGTNTTSTNFFGTNLAFTNARGSYVTSTTLDVTGSVTSTFANAISARGSVSSTSGIVDSYFTVYGNTTLGDASTDTITANGRFNADLVPLTDTLYSLGSLTNRWLSGFFTNVTSTNASSTYLYALNATIPNLTSTNLTWTNATGTNTTSTNGLYGTTLGFSVANGTSVTTTNAFATNLGFTSAIGGNATTTNLYTTNFGFQNASGTNATTTNLSVVNAINNTLRSNTTFRTLSATTTLADPRDIFVSGKYAYVVSNSADMRIYDVSNPSVPAYVSTLSGLSSANKVYVDGGYAYVGAGSYLRIVDVSNPSAPDLVRSISMGNNVSSIFVRGGYAYVMASKATPAASLVTVDVARPDQAVVINSLAIATGPNEFTMQGRYGYVINNGASTISVVDLLNPRLPRLVGSTSLGGTSAYQPIVSGKYLYVLNNATTAGLRVYDISDPTAPFLRSTLVTSQDPAAQGASLAGHYLFIPASTADGRVLVVDVQDPSTPVEVMNYALSGGVVYSTFLSGRYLYALQSSANLMSVVDIMGIETTGLVAASAEVGTLQVLGDGRVVNQFTAGGLAAGRGGIASVGALSISATNTTSTILGNLAVGTSSQDVALNSLFVMNGDDLLVGGNIGSASSVYTNGAFVAGSGSTWFGNGFITKNDGNLTINASGGFITPAGDGGVALGSDSLRYDANLRNATSTNTTSTNSFATNLAFTNARGSYVTSTTLDVTGSVTSTFANAISARGSVSSTAGIVDSYFTVYGSTTLGDASTDTITANGRFNADLVPLTDTLYSLGSLTNRWLSGFFTNVTSTNASSTYLYALNATIPNLTSTNLTWTNATGTNTTSTNGLYGTTLGFSIANGTSVTTTNAFTTNLGFTSAIGGNATTTNLYTTNFEFQNASGTSATTTNFATINSISNILTPGATLTTLGSVSAGTSPTDVFVEGNLAFTVNTSTNRMTIVDVSTSTNPVVRSNILTGGTTPRGVHVAGRYAYVVHDGDNSLSVIDVSNPSNPVVVGRLTAFTDALKSIFVSGRYAYAGGDFGFDVVDISTPSRPMFVARSAGMTGAVSSVYVQGTLAYVVSNGSNLLYVLDVSDPSHPTALANVASGVSSLVRVSAQGSYAYVVGSNGIAIVDVSNPSFPVAVGTIALSNSRNLFVSGRYAYVTTANGLQVIDVGNPFSPTSVKTHTLSNAQGVFVKGREAYVTEAEAVNTLRVIRIPGVETTTLLAHTAEVGSLQVLSNGRIANQLSVGGGLNIGHGGIFSDGSLSISATNTTSSILGNLAVGTSSQDVALNSQFVMSGDDLLVGGNIGSASSVYTNGAFIAGTTPTYYNNGSLINTLGNYTVSSTGSLVVNANSKITLTAADDLNIISTASIKLTSVSGLMIPTVDGGLSLGSSSNRFDAYLRNTTSTSATSTNFFATNLGFTSAIGGSATTTNLYTTNLEFQNASGTSATTTSFATINSISNILTPGATLTSVGSVSNITSAADIFVMGDLALVVNTSTNNLTIVDVSTSTNPVVRATVSTGGTTPRTVYASGRYAYVVHDGDSSLSIIDISNPSVPVVLGRLASGLGTPQRGIFVSGKYAYITVGGDLRIVDVGNPAQPRLVKSISVGATNDYDVYVQGGFAYVVNLDDAKLYIVDVSDPVHAVAAGNVASTVTSPNKVFVQGSYAYVAGSDKVAVIDVAKPTAPVFESGVSISNARDLFVSGRYAYVTTNNGLQIIDVNNPMSPSSVKTHTLTAAQGVFVKGREAYVTEAEDKNLLRIIRLPNTEVMTLLAHTAEVGSLQVLSNGQIGNQLNVSGELTVGRGGILSDGALAISATNTTSSVLGNFMVGTSTRDVALNAQFTMNGDDLLVGGNIGSASSVYTNGAFIAGTGSTYFGDGFITKTDGSLTMAASSNMTLSTSGGNLTLAPSTKITLNPGQGSVVPNTDGGVALGNSTLRFDGYFRSVTTTNSIDNYLQSNSSPFAVTSSILNGSAATVRTPASVFVSGRYAYVGATSKDVLIYDIGNPTSPSSTGIFGNVSSGANDVIVEGRYAYVLDSSGALLTVDVSNPSVPVTAFTMTVDTPQSLAISGRYAYVTEQGSSNDLLVIDISHATGPRMIARLATGFSAPRDVYVSGRYAYVTDTGSSKLFIVDVSAPSAPSIVGTVATANTPIAVRVQGRYAYVGSAGSGKSLQMIDVSSPTAPLVLQTLSLAKAVASHGLFVNGRYAYAALDTGGLYAVDILDPSNPVTVVTVASADNFAGLYVNGRYAYLGDTTRKELVTIDLTGIETTALNAHSAQLGDLQVLTNGKIAQNLIVGGSLNVGPGGMYAAGPSAIVGSSTQPLVQIMNQSVGNGLGSAWGAYINTLLVGVNANATGTDDYSMVINYDPAGAIPTVNQHKFGLCVDSVNASSLSNCVGLDTTSTIYSIIADDAIGANRFDLAENYAYAGAVTSSDLLIFDNNLSKTVKTSTGVPYDAHLVGVASTNPGFVLGLTGGTAVALTGRVPLKTSPINGPISIGDPLTSSPYPGVAMKATKPGMIVGYALEPASTTSTIEVFVKVGYSASSILNTDGTVARITDDLVIAATSTASASQAAVDSWGLTFRGSAWDGTAAISNGFTLVDDTISSTSSQFAIRDSSSANLFTIDQVGTTRLAGDLHIGGKLYPSARGSTQDGKYIFLDDTLAPTSTYMATNADGWQANDSYDFAERYYSPDELEPGDVVIASQRGRFHVQRSFEDKQMLMGIVSTKPAFVTGRPVTSTYPVALAGRVPTKVSTLNGTIKTGDPLTASTIPGVAVKATVSGPIVGLALEDYETPEVGKIEVFVNPGWWGGGETKAKEGEGKGEGEELRMAAAYRGFALVEAGAKYVHVSYASLQAYPNVQVTPHGEVEGGWWTDHLSDVGFDVILKQAQTHDVIFAWQVQATGQNERVYMSDGTSATVDPTTGVVVRDTQTTSTSLQPPASTQPPTPLSGGLNPEPESTPTTEQPTPVASPLASSSTQTVAEEGAAVSSTTP